MSRNVLVKIGDPVIRIRLTYYALLVVALLLLPLSSFAEIQLEAEVDQEQVTIGGRITYTVTVSGEMRLPDIEPPDFEGLKILAGPSTSSSTQIVNTQVSSSKSMTYVLRAINTGTVTIKPATVKHKRKTYSTKPITIQVMSAGRSPSTTPSSSSQSRSDVVNSKDRLPEVFIVARAEKDTLYLREMVTITYDLYLKITVSNYSFVKTPSATGFWQEEFDLPRQPQLRDVTLRRQDYKVATIRKIGLFPTRTGELEIEPLLADVTVEKPASGRRSRRDPFDWFFDDRKSRETRTLSTETLKLTVLDLPLRGRKSSFKGDVGDYDLRVNYDKRELAQHDALTIKVTISGKGYLKSIDPPKLNLPSGFEQFDPTVDENITTSGSMVRGRKQFSYLVIPRRVGTFELQPIEFSFFNPATERYSTQKAGGTTLTVTLGDGSAFSEQEYRSSAVDILDSDIRFIKELSKPLTKVEIPIYKSNWFYIVLFLPMGLFILGLAAEKTLQQRLADPIAVRRRKVSELVCRTRNEAAKLEKSGEIGKAVKISGVALKELIGVKVNIPVAGLTRDLIQTKLTTMKAEPGLIEEAVAVFDVIEKTRFGYSSFDDREGVELLSRLSELSKRLEGVQ